MSTPKAVAVTVGVVATLFALGALSDSGAFDDKRDKTGYPTCRELAEVNMVVAESVLCIEDDRLISPKDSRYFEWP